MNVLIIPSWYVTEDKPNNGIFFKEQAQALQKAGMDVTVIYPDLRFRLGHLRRGLYRADNAPVATYICRRRTLTPFWERGRRPQLAFMLEQLYRKACVERGRPDLVHLHSCRMGIETLRLCKKHRLPLVYTEHYTGVMEPDMPAALMESFEKTLRGCHCALAVSNSLQKKMSTVRGDTRYLPNLIDTDVFRILPQEKNRDFIFAAMGGLVARKGYDILLQAFAEVQKQIPEVRLTLAGDGSEETALRMLAQRLNIAEKVLFCGRVTREQAPVFYNRCGCLICSSYCETFGMTLIEALACGKPVISTRCGGPESIVNSLNGLLVEPGSVKELTAAMIQIYRNRAQYDSNTLRENCINEFGDKQVTAELLSLYKDVLNGNETENG